MNTLMKISLKTVNIFSYIEKCKQVIWKDTKNKQDKCFKQQCFTYIYTYSVFIILHTNLDGTCSILFSMLRESTTNRI